jgi:alpha/beta superfamily hydrolase
MIAGPFRLESKREQEDTMRGEILQSSGAVAECATSKLQAVHFRGPAGRLEGLWKEAAGERRGSAVFAHPHPLHGGTLHNKVVFRAARALTNAGFATLRFNFRGVGLSEGEHNGGQGEIEDFRAAMDLAERRAGLPIIAGGFSFGAATALRAVGRDPRVSAFLGIGLPLATESGAGLAPPSVPALFVTGERDTFGPPALVSELLAGASELVVIPGADHFFEGKLDSLESVLTRFLEALPAGRSSS